MMGLFNKEFQYAKLLRYRRTLYHTENRPLRFFSTYVHGMTIILAPLQGY